MSVIDFILNLAGLLLWLNWRAANADPLGRPLPATLIGTLRRAEPGKPGWWHLPVVLGGLLLLRALFYWQIGSAAGWAGKLNLGIVVFWFPNNSQWSGLGHMIIFSFFSFARTLGIIYLWLVLLSILSGPRPTHRLVTMQLGKIDGWPRWIKFLLPLAVITLVWGLASWPFAWLHPKPGISAAHRIEESLVIALGSYLVWKFLMAALLALHLLNGYIYFGKHPFWGYVDATAQTLLQPLNSGLRWLSRVLIAFLPSSSPLRARKVNYSPAVKSALASLLIVAGIALVFLLAELAGHALIFIYGRLPL